jgi:hypothetical protein
MKKKAPPQRRRWFPLLLRALLLAVVFVVLWLGWDLIFIRERKAWLRDNPDLVPAGGKAQVWLADGSVVRLTRPAPAREPFFPPWRRLLGDAPVATILDVELTADKRATAKRLFPEAELVPMQRPQNIKGLESTTTAEPSAPPATKPSTE